jgi:signal transduction histidine kinase
MSKDYEHRVQTSETLIGLIGLHSSPGAGRLQLVVRPTGEWLEMSVRDDGQGVPSTEVERLFFAERSRVHALVLLRRRLPGLFGRSFQLEVRSEIGEGTSNYAHSLAKAVGSLPGIAESYHLEPPRTGP